MSSSTYDDLGKLILRLGLGILLLLHGLSKLDGGVGWLVDMLGQRGLPGFVAYGVYIGEVLAPVLIILGVFTRLGGLIVVINMLFVFGLVHMHQLFELGKSGGWALELQGMFMVAAIAIALFGDAGVVYATGVMTVVVLVFCEILPKINGYKVHADKIIRMGVPVYLNTSVVSVEGDGKVERITIAEVDREYKPLLDTARTFDVDTVLVATGLSPCDELYRQAIAFGFTAVKAGDAEEIAEASSAMVGGRIAALTLVKMLGRPVEIDHAWLDKREVLKSRPGDIIARDPVQPGASWKPVFFCNEEIPCNPCTTVCPTHSIQLKTRKGSILDLPYFEGDNCKGCSACVAACPGLAVSLVKRIDATWAETRIPFEFDATPFAVGTRLPALDQNGQWVEDAELLDKKYYKKYRTWVLTLKVKAESATRVIGVRVQDESVTRPLPQPRFSHLPDNAIVCRCERITVGTIVDFIRQNEVRDINQLKTIRVGMGACGSKTCSVLLPQFVSPAQGAIGQQFALLGVILVSLGLTFDVLCALAGGALGRWMAAHPRVQKWQGAVFGGALIAFGLRLTLNR